MRFEFRQGKQIKNLNLGFSWTILLFGPVTFFLRRQFILAVSWLVLDLWISYLYLFVYKPSHMTLLTVPMGIDICYSVFWIGMSFFGNRWTCYHLHKKGSLITPSLTSAQINGLPPE